MQRNDMNRKLRWAIRKNKVEIVHQLLRDHIDDPNFVNGVDYKGRTPLLLALKYPHHEIAMLLLEWPKVNFNASDENNRGVMFYLSLHVNSQTTKAFLSHPKFTVPTTYDAINDTISFLNMAVRINGVDVMRLLFAKGVSVEICHPSREGYDLFVGVRRNRQTEIIKLIMQQPSFNVNRGTRVLDAAVYDKQLFIKLLNHPSIDLGCVRDSDSKELAWIAEHASKEILIYVVTSLDIVFHRGFGGFKVKIKASPEAFLTVLINHRNFNINGTLWNDETPLTYALKHKMKGLRDLLWSDKRLDVDACNRHGESPLIVAAGLGLHNTVRQLLRLSADLTLQRQDGHTALTLAGANGHRDICNSLLVDPRFDPAALYQRNQTLLMLAAVKRLPWLVDVALRDERCLVNAQDNEGNTALTLSAIHSDDAFIVEALLKQGADPTIKNKQNYDAQMEAIRHQHAGICPMIERAFPSVAYCRPPHRGLWAESPSPAATEETIAMPPTAPSHHLMKN